MEIYGPRASIGMNDESSFNTKTFEVKRTNSEFSKSKMDFERKHQKILDTPLQYLKGVGPKLGEIFARKGLRTYRDLLDFYPRAYEDQRAIRNISSLRDSELVSLKVQIISVQSIPLGRTGKRMFLVTMRDDSGVIQARYFRVPYKGYFDRLQPYKFVRLVGKATEFRGKIEFHHPDIKDFDEEEPIEDKIIPIYTEVEGLSSHKIHKLVLKVLEALKAEGLQPEGVSNSLVPNMKDEIFREILPSWILKESNLISKSQAIFLLHDPHLTREGVEMRDSTLIQSLLEGTSPAHRRIIFEEFFFLELFLAARRSGFTSGKGKAIPTDSPLISQLRRSLPFELTKAQKRVIQEILGDMNHDVPMYRLVQGDVGSGKTMVSFLAVAAAAGKGAQSCLMVPTEILAEQHFQNAKKFLEPLGIRCWLLSGKTKKSERDDILERLLSGDIHLLVGTHALLEDWVQFQNLALVIIDEQHRFGVEQRGILKDKGGSPHFLVMTATPIPRTLAMTVYGDLEVSVIDELPPGRSPIQTRVIGESKRDQALLFMEQQLKQGRQAYIIYPLVAESEKLDLKNAIEEFDKLRQRFPNYKIGLLHGKMSSEDKDSIMGDFRQNSIQILISTTVIEVGVDVPNANFMMIEHAERFGLSQLHQLRGRVGRGSYKSYCILALGHAVSEEARQRTNMMEKSNDGFQIAEFDLEMRGPGDLLGTQQSGLPGFKMANLVRDYRLLIEARKAAFAVLKRDPQLRTTENGSLRTILLERHGPLALAGIA